MAQRTLVYVGTYTRKGSEGIYVFEMDADGALHPAARPAKTPNPSFLAIHPNGRALYSVAEVGRYAGRPSGAAAAFAIDDAGALRPLNTQPSRGQGPCHLSVDSQGRFLFVANYASGSVAMLPILPDGRLGEATDFHQHEGSSANPKRQAGPHAHSITIGPQDRFAFAADLGLDKVLIYELVFAEGRMKPHDPAWVKVKPGAGPRHFAFHPDAAHAYLINELDNTLVAFDYDAEAGRLVEKQTVSTLPADFKEVSYCADVHVSPDGRFVYGSNRGHDSIAIFAVKPDTGELTPAGWASTRGRTPRNFAIDPTGRFMLVANQDSDNIVTFRIDPESGALSPTGAEARVSMPVCLKFLRV